MKVYNSYRYQVNDPDDGRVVKVSVLVAGADKTYGIAVRVDGLKVGGDGTVLIPVDRASLVKIIDTLSNALDAIDAKVTADRVTKAVDAGPEAILGLLNEPVTW